MKELLFKEECYEIVGAAMKVWNTLGHGFLEKVYENSLVVELRKQGFHVEQQKPIQVCYDGKVVGDYFADIIVNESIILELKAVETISKEHIAQMLNYLKATAIRLGILLNFGPHGLEHKRLVM